MFSAEEKEKQKIERELRYQTRNTKMTDEISGVDDMPKIEPSDVLDLSEILASLNIKTRDDVRLLKDKLEKVDKVYQKIVAVEKGNESDDDNISDDDDDDDEDDEDE